MAFQIKLELRTLNIFETLQKQTIIIDCQKIINKLKSVTKHSGFMQILLF